MEDAHKKKIEEIMEKMHCHKNFKCADSGFKVLCKAEDVGHEEYLDCLESNPNKCFFALSFGSIHYCTCRVRIYLRKQLGK